MTDERYKQIMADLGMPDSRSLLAALQQVANEVAQETKAAALAQQQAALVGYMNAGQLHEMKEGRLPYGYVYPAEGPGANEAVYTYASTQATNCAGCGEYKHTPLRIDAMGGYVCLTCIDRKLGGLLGEFGYPQEPAPAAAPAAKREPLTESWVSVDDGLPKIGTQCLVFGQEEWERSPSIKITAWDELHESPVSFSSATICVGEGWVDGAENVTHWMPLPPAPGGIGGEA